MIAAKQIMFQVISLLSFSSLALAAVPFGETVTLTPSGDTTVRGGSYENDNLSTSGTFGTKQSKTPLNTREGLVKFTLTDLYATGGVVSSAILTLQVRSNNNDAGTAEIAVSSILDDEWEDNVVTFATKPTYASTPIETKFAPPKGDEMTFDLTDAITTAWSFGSKTVSFAFTGLTTSAVSFASIDDTKVCRFLCSRKWLVLGAMSMPLNLS
uniref:Carbohydrate-binding module family 96 domain-containing protein n=1 Tax=Entomoneis paludosa TaxID=265537 RepID=A0A6U3BSZ5_9STRA|mmetsp:Transcript_33027/g.68805  ORF Transcript_33027/g.68805 Transcript_33027/m.68805 type:complete len:212 (+) Transcript_33027:453-1088(+)